MDENDAIAALSALAHEGRLQIFRRLVAAGENGLAAGEVAAAVAGLQNTTSSNLAILARAGLVASRREGRSVRYFAETEAAGRLIAFLLADCCSGRPESCAPVLATLGVAQRAAEGAC